MLLGSNVDANTDGSDASQMSPFSTSAVAGGVGLGPNTSTLCPAGPRMASSGIHFEATESHAAAPPCLNSGGSPIIGASTSCQMSPGCGLAAGGHTVDTPLTFSGGPGSPRSPFVPRSSPASTHA